MFGFGKQKFIGSRNKDLAYLKGFLIGQPLPSPLGWYAQKLPRGLLKAAVLFMFFVEIPAPFFVFVPGPLSVVFAAATAFLMVGIQAMGSFGYFSLVTIVGCLPLLDNTTPLALELTGLFSPGQPILVNAFVVLHTLCACVAFPFNSWLAKCWHLWAFWYQLPRFVQPLFGFVRFAHPFRWVHPYGVFPPNTGPGVKVTLLVEVTLGRKEWHELEFRFSPSNPRSAAALRRAASPSRRSGDHLRHLRPESHQLDGQHARLVRSVPLWVSCARVGVLSVLLARRRARAAQGQGARGAKAPLRFRCASPP